MVTQKVGVTTAKDGIMGLKTTILVTILFVIAFMAGPAAAAPGECPQSAQVFWTSFRHAALKRGASEVSRYTVFPFQVAGTLDSSERREIDKSEFRKIFPSLLTTDPGLSPQPTTMRCLVKATLTLPARSCNESSKEFRIGSWLFQLTAEGWKFVRAYIED